MSGVDNKRSSILGGIGILRLNVGAVRPFLEYSLVDFFAMNLDFGWRRDPDTYLVTFHTQYGNGDNLANDKFLTNFSCQYEHSNTPWFRTHHVSLHILEILHSC